MSLQDTLNKARGHSSAINNRVADRRQRQTPITYQEQANTLPTFEPSIPTSSAMGSVPVIPDLPKPKPVDLPDNSWDWRQNEAMNVKGGKSFVDSFLALTEANKKAENQRMGSPFASRGPAVFHRGGYTQEDKDRADLREDLKAQSGDAFANFLEASERKMNAQAMKDTTKETSEFAKAHPVVGSMLSVPSSMAGGSGILSAIGQKAENKLKGTDAPIDYNAPGMAPSAITQSLRGQVAQDIEQGGGGKVGSFLYQTGMSMADSLATIGLGMAGLPGSVGLLGGSAATQAMQDAQQRGASDNQAIGLGLVAGIAETAMEKVGIDNLFKLKPGDGFLKNIVKQALPEAGEEVATTIANTVADVIVMGDKSEYFSEANALMAQGMSREEAERRASVDWLKGLGLDALGGGLSGGIFGAGRTGIGKVFDYFNAGHNAVDTSTAAPDASTDTSTAEEASDVPETNAGNSPPSATDTDVGSKPLEQAPMTPLDEAMYYARTQGQILADVQQWTPGSQGYLRNIDPNNHHDMTRVLLGRAERVGGNPEMIRSDIDPENGNRVYSVFNRDRGWIRIATVENADNTYGNIEQEEPAIDNDHDSRRDELGRRFDSFAASSPHGEEVAREVFEENLNGEQRELLDEYLAMRRDDGTVSITENVGEDNDVPTNQPEAAVEQEEDNAQEEAAPAAEPEARPRRQPRPTRTITEEGTGMPQPGLFEAQVTGRQAPRPVHTDDTNIGRGVTNTQASFEDRNNVPEEQRYANQPDIEYQVRHMHDVQGNATDRLSRNYAGEIEHLRRANSWNDEDVAMAHTISYNLLQDAKATDNYEAYQEWNRTVDAHRQTSGQAVNAWKFYAQNSGEGIMAYTSRVVENAHLDQDQSNAIMQRVQPYADAYDAAMAEGANGINALTDLITETARERRVGTLFGNRIPREIRWALDRVAHDAATNEASLAFLQSFARDSIISMTTDTQQASLIDRANTIRRNAMLSKISTVLRNLVGNNVFDPVDALAVNASVPLDMLLSHWTGTRSTTTDLSWASQAKRQGTIDALAMAVMQVGLDVDNTGSTTKYTGTSNRTFHAADGGFSRLMSAWEKAMGYTMGVTDSMQKGGIAAETQRGLDSLYDRGLIADDSLREGGQTMADYRTFQGDSHLSRFALGARNLGNQLHEGLGDFILPFAQVPANLASIAKDYSPVGVLQSMGEIVNVLRRANAGALTAAEQAQAVQRMGRGVTGSMMIAGFAALAKAGLLHVENPGDKEENKDKAAQDRMHGFQGTQWNLSGTQRWLNGEDPAFQPDDEMISIGFLDPFSAMMTTGALIAEDDMSEMGPAEKTGNVGKRSLEGTVQAVMDLPVMDQLRSFFDTLQYSQADTEGGKIMDATADVLASGLTGFVPNAVRGVAQGMDPYERVTFSKDFGENLGNKIKSGIPGLRESLPVRLNSFGEPVMAANNDKDRWMNSNISPGKKDTYYTNDVMDGIDKLYAETGDAKVFLKRQAPKSFNVDGKELELTREQQETYQKSYGKTDSTVRGAMFKSKGYGSMSNELKLKANEYAEKYADQIAKQDVDWRAAPETWVKDLSTASPAEVAEYINNKVYLEDAKQTMTDRGQTENVEQEALGNLYNQNKISWDFLYDNLSESEQKGYDEHIAPAGVSKNVFVDLLTFAGETHGDKDANGKTTYSKQNKVIDYIDKQKLDNDDAIALFMSLGYSTKSIPYWWK